MAWYTRVVLAPCWISPCDSQTKVTSGCELAMLKTKLMFFGRPACYLIH